MRPIIVIGHAMAVGAIAAGVALVAFLVASPRGMIPFLHPRDGIVGMWTLKTQTEEATELTYTVSLAVDGRQVTGKGLKLGEKSAGGTYTDCKACTTFDINGSLDMDGDSLKAWFTEEGELSPTSGHLELEKKGKSWVGTFLRRPLADFNSEVATSSGTALL